MAKTHFENLRVYQLSELLSDQIWRIILTWDNFARNTIGSQIVRSADSVGANLRKEADAEAMPTTNDLSGSLAARCTKLATGCDVPTNVNC